MYAVPLVTDATAVVHELPECSLYSSFLTDRLFLPPTVEYEKTGVLLAYVPVVSERVPSDKHLNEDSELTVGVEYALNDGETLELAVRPRESVTVTVYVFEPDESMTDDCAVVPVPV